MCCPVTVEANPRDDNISDVALYTKIEINLNALERSRVPVRNIFLEEKCTWNLSVIGFIY